MTALAASVRNAANQGAGSGPLLRLASPTVNNATTEYTASTAIAARGHKAVELAEQTK